MSKPLSLTLILLLFLLINGCETTSSPRDQDSDGPVISENIELVAPKTAVNKPKEKQEIKQEFVKEEPIYSFIENAKSIKILAHSIESGDFATRLFIEKLKGKDITLLFSERSASNMRSKKRYFDQVGIKYELVNFPGWLSKEAFMIIDDSIVVKDVLAALLEDENKIVRSFTILDEKTKWNVCLVQARDCFAAFKIEKSQLVDRRNKAKELGNLQNSQSGRISTQLPSKTKRRKYIDLQQKYGD